MDAMKRQAQLTELAQRDKPYQLWARVFAESREAFAAFADAQPPEIRQVLWSYAEGGRLMNQRLVNLACREMVFPGKATSDSTNGARGPLPPPPPAGKGCGRRR